MKIKEIEVEFGYTYNLGNYSNVRPLVKLKAEPDEGENPDQIKKELLRLARSEVYAQIDQALEDQDDPPKFFTGPLFDLVHFGSNNLAALIPSETKASLPHGWSAASRYTIGRREEIARAKVAALIQGGYTVHDCANGDFSQLPRLTNYVVLKDDPYQPSRPARKILVLALEDGPKNEMHIHGYYRHLVEPPRLADLFNSSGWQEYTFHDCTDGDFTKLPPRPEPEPEKPKRKRSKKAVEAAEPENEEA